MLPLNKIVDMDWESHDRWAKKLDISQEVSRYVNRIVDENKRAKLPDDYKKAVNRWAENKAAKDGAKKGNSALHLVIKRDIKETHDKGAGTKTADTMAHSATVNLLKQKGDDYLVAYYLHHHLDYLSENRNSGKDISQLIEDHEKGNSKPFNTEIANFLLNHEKELSRELNL